MDGGAGSDAGGERGTAGNCGNADYAGRAVGLEADAYRENYSGFSEWENAGIRGDSIEFCGRGRVRGRASVGGGEGQGWREVSAGSGEPDAEGVAGFAGADNGVAGPGNEDSAWGGA